MSSARTPYFTRQEALNLSLYTDKTHLGFHFQIGLQGWRHLVVALCCLISVYINTG